MTHKIRQVLRSVLPRAKLYIHSQTRTKKSKRRNKGTTTDDLFAEERVYSKSVKKPVTHKNVKDPRPGKKQKT